jgi:hypothetical protein
MNGSRPTHAPNSRLAATLVAASLFLLMLSVASGVSPRLAVGAVVLATLAAFLVRWAYVPWSRLLAALILVILFIPIRRYTLPVSLPIQLEPYRIFVALLVLGWSASLLVDRRVTFRRSGFEGPLVLILASACASVVANPGRVSNVSSEVNKSLLFLLSYVLVLYMIVSAIRRFDDVDYVVKTLVVGGATVGVLAIIEARTGFNAFNHLSRVVPLLRNTGDASGPDMLRFGSARMRVFASAQHPIALSAAFVVLTPLALYLGRRYAQRRWWACALILAAACASTVSRTGILMFVVVALMFLWLRPRETKRLWPALIPALLVIHVALPGTLGSIKNSFAPPGGLVNEQRKDAGQSGSGRIADISPALHEWKREPLFGQGYGTRIVDPTASEPQAQILDDQWLTSLLETGALGFAGWLWFFLRAVRRFGAEAKRDESARGWLLAAIAAAVAAYAIGMLTYDAFSFIQVTFLLFILVALGAALMAEQPLPHAVLGTASSRGSGRVDPAGSANA